jgi:hypothetical protein
VRAAPRFVRNIGPDGAIKASLHEECYAYASCRRLAAAAVCEEAGVRDGGGSPASLVLEVCRPPVPVMARYFGWGTATTLSLAASSSYSHGRAPWLPWKAKLRPAAILVRGSVSCSQGPFAPALHVLGL